MLTGGKERDHLLASARLASGGAVGIGRHLAIHNGHVDASLLEDVSVLEHARDAAATAGTGPSILLDRAVRRSRVLGYGS